MLQVSDVSFVFQHHIPSDITTRFNNRICGRRTICGSTDSLGHPGVRCRQKWGLGYLSSRDEKNHEKISKLYLSNQKHQVRLINLISVSSSLISPFKKKKKFLFCFCFSRNGIQFALSYFFLAFSATNQSHQLNI